MMEGFNYEEALKTRAEIKTMIGFTEEEIRVAEEKKLELTNKFGEARFVSPIKELFEKMESSLKGMRMNNVQYHVLLNDLNKVISFAENN